MSVLMMKNTIHKKRILELLFILVVCVVIFLPRAISYGQIAAWRALYPAVQTASINDPTILMPLACALGPIEEPVVRQNLQDALKIYEHEAVPSVNLMSLAGQAYCWLGENEKAQLILEEALQKTRVNNLVALELIALYQKNGNNFALQELLDRRLVSVGDLMKGADSFTNQKNYIAALDWCRLALSVEPSLEQAWERWYSIGLKYEQNDDWQQAMLVYRAALDYQKQSGYAPYHASFLYKVGVNLVRLDDSASEESAGPYYDQAIADGRFLDKSDLATVFQLRGDWRREHRADYSLEDYMNDYRRALELKPIFPIAFMRIGQVYLDEYQDPAAAKQYLEQAVYLDPQLSSGFYYLGQACFISGDFYCAKQAFQSAVDLKPDWEAAIDRLMETQKRLDGLP
jgi:tetratricopeptide (TPR) repeat protein